MKDKAGGFAEKLAWSLQFIIATLVAFTLLWLFFCVQGPNIDGDMPSTADNVQGAVVFLIIGASLFASAVLLFKRKRAGWWLSLALDALLTFGTAAAIWGDINLWLEGEGVYSASAGRGDLVVHGSAFVLGLAAVVVLLTTYRADTATRPAATT